MKLDFDSTDERRVLANGLVVIDVLRIGEVPVLRTTHHVGWRWSVHSSSGVGEERCGNVHIGVMTSGRMMVELSDGAQYEARSGDTLAIPAGHDAWTIGDEPAVFVQFDEGESAQSRYRR